MFCRFFALLWLGITVLLSCSVVAVGGELERELVAAEPASWLIGSSAGVLGLGVEVSRGLGSHWSMGVQYQYGRLTSDHDFDYGGHLYNYTRTSNLKYYSAFGRFYPWREGAYAQFGMVYSDHGGRGYWREYPVFLGDIEVTVDQQSFEYRFSPLALSVGVGWQGAYVVHRQAEVVAGRIEFGLAFDLIVHTASTGVTLTPAMLDVLGRLAARRLSKTIADDLDDAKILPNLSLRLAYAF